MGHRVRPFVFTPDCLHTPLNRTNHEQSALFLQNEANSEAAHVARTTRRLGPGAAAHLTVAKSAGVNVNTIRNMEARGAEPIASGAMTVRKVEVALEALGIEFLNHARPGVRLNTHEAT